MYPLLSAVSLELQRLLITQETFKKYVLNQGLSKYKTMARKKLF